MGFYDKAKHSVRYWLLRRLPTCQQTVAKLSEAMEHRLTLSDRIRVKVHLWICAWCQWYFEHLHVMRDAARAKGAESTDLAPRSTLSDEARERIRRKLAGET